MKIIILGNLFSSIVLMGIFFVVLVALDVVHMVLLGSCNEIVFNSIILVVGTIVGAIWEGRIVE